VDHDSQGRECLHWHDGKSGRNYTVIHPQLTLQQLDAYQTELSQLAEEGNGTSELSPVR
jgi:hypothetical protein